MKTAKKILSVFMAILMLFSVMSISFSSIAASVTVGSLTGNDGYESTEDVIICVPETIYMTPGDSEHVGDQYYESVSGQYYVNNIVDANGNVTLEAEKSQTSGSITIYAPDAVKFSFNANCVIGGIGDPIIGTANTSSTASFEYADNNSNVFGITNGHFSYTALALYVNGKGLTHGQTALVEWVITVYSSDDDTTGTNYYAYTTLYMPLRSVGAVAEARKTSDINNEISSWISGITSVGSPNTTLSENRYATEEIGYLTYDPLWTSVFGVGSSETAGDYVTHSDTEKYAHASATDGQQYSRSVGYTGYLRIDSSRYSNTDQVPNFQIGADILRIGSAPKNSTDKYYIWYTLGKGNESIATDEDASPSGWDFEKYEEEIASTNRWSIAPSYNVSEVDGKYLHIASQCRAYYTWTLDSNYSNAYVSMVFSVCDKSDLRALVLQATGLDETKYTVASWRGLSATAVEAFQEALRDAAMVLGNPGASQNEVNSAVSTLTEKMNALQVTIKFDAATNGGIFADGETLKEYNVRFGASKSVELRASLLNYFPVVKNGYELAGWSTDPDDYTTASLTSLADITFGTTLYAHYKKTITVDFYFLKNASGKTDVLTQAITIYNLDDSALDVFVDDADDVGVYKFAGWTLDPESTEGVDLGSKLENVTENAVYFATYVKELVLNFDVDGGTYNKDFITGGVGYNYNLENSTGVATVVLPEDEPTKTGYSFEGWNIGGTVYQPGDEIEFSGNTTRVTATAVWGIEKYDVTFNFKDADGNDISVTEKIEYGQDIDYPEISEYYSDDSKHYKFTNWDKTLENITEDIVVTAQYDAGTGHSFTIEGTPNCEETVDVIYTCGVCNHTYTVTVEKGHNYIVIDSKEPDCENDGYINYVCTRDSTHTHTEVLKATGHSFENTEYVDSTCTQDGYYISGTCATCGEDLAGKKIPAKGHDYQVVEFKDKTCTENGYEKYECSRCKDSYTKEIECTGHDYIVESVAPTCTKDGSNSYTCTKCGYLYDVRVPALGHTYVSIIFPPTCSSEGYTSLTCTVCGTAIKTDVVDALGHQYDKVTVVAPTCSAQGYTKHTCSVCDYSYKTDFVDALGHDYSITTVVEPTCTAKGYTLHECANCGGTYKTDYVDANGHNYEQIEYVNATVTQNGYYLLKCKDCGMTYRDYVFGNKALLCITIKDTEGNIVKGATITFTDISTNKQIVVVTDNNGYFTHFIPDGNYTITIAKSGYLSDTKGDIKVELGTASILLPEIEKNPCSCLCHQDSFIAKIYRFIIKMFSIFGNIYCCDCCEIWD